MTIYSQLAHGEHNTLIWKFADAELDEALRELRVDGTLVEIEPRPFDLLLLLLNRADEVVSIEEIIAKPWAGRVVNDASYTNVANAISKLRKLLKDDRREIIKTISKVGYRLSARVERRVKAHRPTSSISILKFGEFVPGRPHWKLSNSLESGGWGDVWIGTNTKTNEERVFKFCFDEYRLGALKREVTLFRVLRLTLGERAPVPALHEWQFATSPYYIEAERWGDNLRAWAAHRGGLSKIPLEIRLHILCLTAEMVAAVHSVGVLHRDLKPQNILVRDDRDSLQVRLCDFGTSILLDKTNLDALEITREGFTHTVADAGTPSYMAPELLARGTPTPQSDVYSLGVLLYQLAIGEWRPMAFGWDADVNDELLRDDIAASINRDPATRPSSALLLAQLIRSLSERREYLQQKREAELQNTALLESIKRTRERRPWVLTAVGALSLAVGISSILMLQARRAAHLAVENERTARNVAEFLIQEMVQQASPEYGGHIDVTLKQAILESVPKIADRVAANLPVAAVLYQSLAESLASLSDPLNAAALARKAANLYANLYGLEDRRTLLARMDEFSYRLLTESAVKLAKEFGPFDDSVRRNFRSTDPVALRSAVIRADLASMHGRHTEAIPMFERILEQPAFQLDAESVRWLDRTRLAHVRSLGLDAQYEKAREKAIILLPHFEKTYGVNSRLSLELRRYLGRSYAAERGKIHDYAAAEAEFTRIASGLRSVYGDDSSELNFALMDMGDLYLLSTRWAEAETLERKLLAGFEKHYGSSSYWTWRARCTLMASMIGQAKMDQNYVRLSLAFAEELLDLLRRAPPDNDYIQGRVLFISAIPLILAKHHDEAAEVIKTIRSSRTNLSSPSESALHRGELNYLNGLLSQSRKEHGLAESYFTNALNELTPVDGPDSMEVRDARQRLDSIRSNQNQRDKDSIITD